MSVQASVRATTSGTRSSSSAPVASAMAAASGWPRAPTPPRPAPATRAAAHDAGDDEAVLGLPEGDGVEHRLRVRAEYVEHRGAGRALGDVRLELGQPCLAAGEHEVLLGGEVVEDRLLGDVGGRGDLGDRDGVEAALGEQTARGGDDRVARGALLALAQALGNLSCHQCSTIATVELQRL